MTGGRLEVYLERMSVAGSRAIAYVDGADRASFGADQRTQDAVIANIAAIGECVTKIMDRFPEFAAAHPEVPWQDIRAMRNRVAHQYFDIDVDTVWRTVTIDLPDLLDQLQSLRNFHAQGE